MNVNTDRLIEMLSANLEPASRSQFGKALILAMVAGGAAAFALMLATIGPRPDLQSTAHLEWSAVKLLFAFSVIGAGAPPLVRSMRPGLEDGTWGLIFLPFFVTIAVAFTLLFSGPPQAWRELLVGASTISPVRCLCCIPFFAVIPWAAVIWALRKGAPTRLKLSGAIAGIVAGGLGAAAYAPSCTSDTIPFIAIWYGLAIALCAAVGARLGPRLLRW
jgi:hypothetical protein